MPDVGELIGGKYTLIRRLGRGGMGAVYEAVHEQIGKAVAVKVLLPQDVDQAELVARFLQEAQAAAAAGHRGIVDIYDVGVCDDGAPYLVMELLQGQSLAELLAAAGSLGISRTAYIVCQVLSALSAAHQAGIVHRDLKPENIFLADTGAPLPEVKLLDFGISRIIVPGSAEQISRMTRSGVVMGTPLYMSPEQAAGKKDIDHQTDLYSIAVILFQCLTGDFPHDADNYNALMASIIADPPVSPTTVMPGLPAPLETIILKGLEKERKARYESAAQMFYELRPYVDSSSIASLRAPVSAEGPGPVVPTLREVSAEAVMAEAPTVYASDSQPPTSRDMAPETPTNAEPLASGAAAKTEVTPGLVAMPHTAVEGPPRRRATVVAVVILIGLVIGGAVTFFTIRQAREQAMDAEDGRESARGSRWKGRGRVTPAKVVPEMTTGREGSPDAGADASRAGDGGRAVAEASRLTGPSVPRGDGGAAEAGPTTGQKGPSITRAVDAGRTAPPSKGHIKTSGPGAPAPNPYYGNEVSEPRKQVPYGQELP